ncbi:hypothetical protein Tco_0698967 [Tanacetum coccineum]
MEEELVGEHLCSEEEKLSRTLTPLIDITPIALDTKYTIKLADGKLVGVDNIIRRRTLNLLNHPFNINLMPVEIESFDVIIGIISCIKTQKYLQKGCHVFLAHVTDKKLEEKRLEDVPIMRDFLEVFPKDLPRLPPTRQVEVNIDLVPGAAPVTRLTPLEMQELSSQITKAFG